MNDIEENVSTEPENCGRKTLENKETTRKIIRVITIIVYLSSVSMAAVMLSLYYLFLWNPTIQPSASKLVQPTKSFSYVSLDSAHLLNESYLNIEREEPRALPVKELQKSADRTKENKSANQDFIKFSPNIEYENKTTRLLKMLKPVINLG